MIYPPIHQRTSQMRPVRVPVLLGVCLALALSVSATPVVAGPSNCSLTVAYPGVLFDKEIGTATRQAMPSTVAARAAIVAKCESSTAGAGSYRWAIAPRSLSLTTVSGGVPNSVLAGIGRRVIVGSYALEVTAGAGSSTSPVHATVTATGQLWNLTSALLPGQYVLSQVFDITEKSCKWTGNHWTCKDAGVLRQYRANYTFTVVDSAPGPGPTIPPTTHPSGDAGSAPLPGRGIKPNPWTVRGYAAKRRCEKCDALRYEY